jgi:hypothetical protein
VVVELGGGPHQTEVAFLNEIEQREVRCHEGLGDLDDEPEVGLDQAAERLAVTPQDAPGELFASIVS